MNHWLRPCALIISFLAISTTAARAQTPLEFDFRIGPAITMGDFSDLAGTGVFLSGTALAKVAPPLSVGLEIGGNVGHENGPLETSIFQLTPVIRVEAPFAEGGIGYLIAGMGYYHTEYEAFGASASFDDFGFNVGAGLLIPVSPNVKVGFDLRYHYLIESGIDPQYLVPGLLITFTP
jgi:hypothetical protein